MGFFSKLRAGQNSQTHSSSSTSGSAQAAAAVAVARMNSSRAVSRDVSHSGRSSNGLKEFLWQLDGVERGHLLDLGPAWQTTITFFIERGFKVYTDDLLTTWKDFLDEEDQKKKELAPDADRSDMAPAARAERFLESTLQYPEGTFDAVLLWDLLDYLDNELMTRVAARVTSMVRDGGVVLGIFHTRKPEFFHRYRVLDAQNLELVPASCAFVPQRVFQNREISNLFSRFRSSKTFVGRDQLREGLFVK
ncbi:MAG TPA: hypothetical protein VNI36_13960 [Candidatus Dormibacteraeota bacterium]|nr:hypothetical protein [Candidatus Dormibacteraeota bacterium]